MRDRGVIRPSLASSRAGAHSRAGFAMMAAILCILAVQPAQARSGKTPPAASASVRTVPSPSALGDGALVSHDTTPVPNATWIRLSNGIAFDTTQPQPPLDAAYAATEAGPGPAYHIVQLRGPVTPAMRAAVEHAGAEVVSYLPEYSFVVRADNAAISRVRALADVRWSGPYQPAYKVSAALNRRLAEGGTAADQPLDIRVLFFPQEDMPAALAAVLGAGTVITRSSDNGINKIAIVRAPRAVVPALSRLRAVAWIEPYAVNFIQNATAQWITQTHVSNNRAIWDHGLHGENQILSISDTGVRTTHDMFRDPAVQILNSAIDYPTHRKIIAYRVMPGATFGDENSYQTTYHGTHTAGSLGGDDSYVGGITGYDGMALKDKLYVLDIGTGPESPTDGGLFGVPADLNDMFIYPYQGNSAGHAFAVSQSWGLTPDALMEGVYEAEAMQIDQFMWLHKDFLVLQSAGNDGSAAGSVEPPATCKDCVTVGYTDDVNGNSIASPSGRGPTDDGRVKPTVVAPGEAIWSANGAADNSYHQLSGTSMSTPITASSCALIRQYLTEGWYPSGVKTAADAMLNPSAALIKAMLVNSADPGSTWPDNNFGWGRIDLDSVLAFSGDTRDLALVDYTAGVETGQGVDYSVTVGGGTIPLKVTLVWTDYPGNVSAATALVNDLDLTVTGPGGTYRGNAIAGNQSVTGGSPDHINVEEWMRLNAPPSGSYTIHVGGSNVPLGPQPFALVVTGDLDRASATVSLDKPAYNLGNAIAIRLEDASPGLLAPVVSLTSSSGDQENVTLFSVGGGVFTGSRTLTFAATVDPNDGVFCAAAGDMITAIYTDASPAGTRTATAIVDATPVVTTQVRVTGAGQTFAAFAWSTSQGARGHIEYGTTTALGASSSTETDLILSHAVSVSGLLGNTLYYFDAVSVDGSGNTTRDDNGGRHYTFTTSTIPADVYLVLGDQSFPADNLARYDAAFARSGWTYDYTYTDVSGDPPLGNVSSGLRSYPGVWWNTGLDQYPMITDSQRSLWQSLHDGGARIAICSHDVAWDFASSQSIDYSSARNTFLQNYLHATWKVDPDPVGFIGGIPGDPISNNYALGIPYTEFRTSGAADEVTPLKGTGTANGSWVDDATPQDSLWYVGVRWQSTGNLGTPGTAVWAGQPTRESAMFWELTQLNVTTQDDPTRADVLDKTLRWLIGRGHPTATITAITPAASTVTIAWSTAGDGGSTIVSTSLQYSQDYGQTWLVLASGALSSPYVWDISHVLNSAHTRLRVVCSDNGSPALHGNNTSADFLLSHAGGDFLGPQVIAGSAVATPYPVRETQSVTVTAVFADSTTGGSLIDAAEYSLGATPIAAGSGLPAQASGGGFGSSTVLTISASVTPGDTCSTCTAWLRAHDAAGNWGPAAAVPYIVRLSTGTGGATGDVSGSVPHFALLQNWPNPFAASTALRFSLAAAGQATMHVYDSNGVLVRTVLKSALPAGPHVARWDGTDNAGRVMPAGVYFYRLDAGGRTLTRKLVRMN